MSWPHVFAQMWNNPAAFHSICSKLSTWPSKCVRTCLSKSCCWQFRGNCSAQTGQTFQWLSTCCSKLRCSKWGGKITSHSGQRLWTSLLGDVRERGRCPSRCSGTWTESFTCTHLSIKLHVLCLLKAYLITILGSLYECGLVYYLESKQKLPLVSLSLPDWWSHVSWAPSEAFEPYK